MKFARIALLVLVLPVAIAGCELKDNSGPPAGDEGPPPIPPPPDVAAPPAEALMTASGLAYKVLTVGLGSIHPTPRSQVRVHYTGWTTDGKMFDSSYQRGNPTTFFVDQVIPGWTEALQLMVVGEKCRVWIPGNLAYENSQRQDAPKGMLVFEIELLDIR
jgi:FKBP-type peptidyl-prolyl cis-trans isomerase